MLRGENVRGDEAPEALRGGERRLAAAREAKARLDAEARDPPRSETALKARGRPETAAREPVVEPVRQEMQPDVAPAANEPVADPLLELRIRERRLETIRASRGRLEAAAGNGGRPAAPWASPSRRPEATRRTRRAES